jgi:starch phosphorylase
VEEPDHWLRGGNPWELRRPERIRRVGFGGHTVQSYDKNGRLHVHWERSLHVLAIPYDLPIPGFQNDTVNTLRLWKATATDDFDLGEFNSGSYPESVAAKNDAENITMVLYPNDSSENGKELRLKQQYFLASASLQDIIGHWVEIHGEDFTLFAEKNCFQMNDTHPTCAVAELMRILLDEYTMTWDNAWEITSKTMAYTNHTLLPEALEKWPVSLMAELLPRILEIIYEINARFLSMVAQRRPGDSHLLQRMSIIEEGYTRYVRMAHLAIIGSFSVNGVAELHSSLLQKELFHDFYILWPEKFNNKTNGVTQRRWLGWANPELSSLITKNIGEDWLVNLSSLKKLAPLANDAAFRNEWFAVKQKGKKRLACLVEKQCGIKFNPDSLFSIQVKRIHEYKRQLLNILHVIHLYDLLKSGKIKQWTPRCILIGGKAAPGYYLAKKIIKLISNVSNVINNDPAIGDKLKVAFFPNYSVTSMETICAGCDLSEQISTAGKEASGTGNMKFMMNGAITIGTLDGANIEIREEVGDDNFFLFGLNAIQIASLRQNYNPQLFIDADVNLKRVMNLLESGHFNQFEPKIFNDLIHSITNPNDPWMTAADFSSYVATQQRVSLAYKNREQWTTMSILNTAYSGKFSTDRSMLEYNRDIWKMDPIKPHALK